MSQITELLETLMRLKGLSQSELAGKSGIHRSNLCRFLAGETDVRLSSLLSLLSSLDVDFAEFLQRQIAQRLRSQQAGESDSLGSAFEVLLSHSDAITKKTLLNTLMTRTQNSDASHEVLQARRFLTRYAATVSTGRNH